MVQVLLCAAFLNDFEDLDLPLTVFLGLGCRFLDVLGRRDEGPWIRGRDA